jgi:hypothetical protein
MNGRFTSELWQGIGGICRAILAHPFLAGLTDGGLPHGTFAFCGRCRGEYFAAGIDHADGPHRLLAGDPTPSPPDREKE